MCRGGKYSCSIKTNRTPAPTLPVVNKTKIMLVFHGNHGNVKDKFEIMCFVWVI